MYAKWRTRLSVAALLAFSAAALMALSAVASAEIEVRSHKDLVFSQNQQNSLQLCTAAGSLLYGRALGITV